MSTGNSYSPAYQQILLPGMNSLISIDNGSTKEESKKSPENENSSVNSQICSMEYCVNVGNRYVRTLITSEVQNSDKSSKETTFSVIVPENAFISEFEMEIDGKIYKAYVKEKEEAKMIYEQAVSAGKSAAHVELSARDSKTFTVSVNVEPESKTIFRLVYEELLLRSNGQYELVVNIHPGQIVEILGVTVHIKESRPLTFIKTASLRTGNEISKNNPKLEPSAKIEAVDPCSANVTFNPNISQQKKFAECLGGSKENGLAGQFVVQYDVERDSEGGEVLIRDGYFVHFFAPTKLKPLPKHVVFVLDHSGSMSGTKIDQLIEAMQNILSQLKIHDLFNIVRFSIKASVWNDEWNKFINVDLESPKYGFLESQLREVNLPDAVKATTENKEKAKNVIKNKDSMNATNIIEGLELGLFLIKKTQEKMSSKYQPMIIFLTDGMPNEGMSSPDEITNTVTKINSGENRTAIFSLSFGEDADKSFLNKLSSKNLGFSKHIYVATDASLQLQDFYSKISSPLLSDVTFTDVDGASDVTKSSYPILFNGSELVVAGRADNKNVSHSVSGRSTAGRVIFNATCTEPVSSLERLWAYLTVKQLLNEKEIAADPTELTKKALELSLKYSFVTEISSLVVVKPDEKDSVNGDSCQTAPPTEEEETKCFRSMRKRIIRKRKGCKEEVPEIIKIEPEKLVTADQSLVIICADHTKKESDSKPQVKPQIQCMQINASVNYNSVTTTITSKVLNLEKSSEEITLPIILSENASISEFKIEIEGVFYEAEVHEKGKAEMIYREAILNGQCAAHIRQSPTNSKLYLVSLNIEPESKPILRIVYEELLLRSNGQYELVINIHPGQIVEDLGVQVHITENGNLTVKTPSLRKENASEDDPPLDPSAEIEIVDMNSANVKFTPDTNQQKKFADIFGEDAGNGLACQFVVRYEVE